MILKMQPYSIFPQINAARDILKQFAYSFCLLTNTPSWQEVPILPATQVVVQMPTTSQGPKQLHWLWHPGPQRLIGQTAGGIRTSLVYNENDKLVTQIPGFTGPLRGKFIGRWWIPFTKGQFMPSFDGFIVAN